MSSQSELRHPEAATSIVALWWHRRKPQRFFGEKQVLATPLRDLRYFWYPLPLNKRKCSRRKLGVTMHARVFTCDANTSWHQFLKWGMRAPWGTQRCSNGYTNFFNVFIMKFWSKTTIIIGTYLTIALIIKFKGCLIDKILPKTVHHSKG